MTQKQGDQKPDPISVIVRSMQAVVRANPDRWSEEMQIVFGQKPEEKNKK